MSTLAPQDVTRILADFAEGDQGAVAALLPVVYGELRRLAATHLREERAGHTLQATALVHEVYMRLERAGAPAVQDRAHFLRLASKLMRQILVDHARAREAAKRGGERFRVTLDGSGPGPAEEPEFTNADIMELDEALSRLEALSAARARLVELRFFGGLSEERAAEALGISRTEASRQWRVARAWLADELRGGR
jgi:RNA polymerase sigma factor (TIGR02999 family)